MKANQLLEALSRKLGTTSRAQLATTLGVTTQTLVNWSHRDDDLSVQQVASALAKARSAAVAKSQLETIRPVVEFYGVSRMRSLRGGRWTVFDGGPTASTYARGLRATLEKSHGIYIYYDSRGRSLYVGKARDQSLWKEMNLAFNRKRAVQKIALVPHPKRNLTFQAGYEKLRQPKDVQIELSSLAHYFSAYQVDDGMIEDLEALMVRGFANDLLNVKMETFAHARG